MSKPSQSQRPNSTKIPLGSMLAPQCWLNRAQRQLNSSQSYTATTHTLLSPAQLKSLLLKLLPIKIGLPQTAHTPLSLFHDPNSDTDSLLSLSLQILTSLRPNINKFIG